MQGIEALFAERHLKELKEKEENQQVEIERVRQQCEGYAIQVQETGQGLFELLQRHRVLSDEIQIYQKQAENKETATQVSQHNLFVLYLN